MVKDATGAVLGEEPLHADIAFVGEQPGNQEDATSRPFVGPAGKDLDKAMAVAGIDRKRTYVTNAVKQFKFELRAKRRIRSKPSTGEVKRCHWLLKRGLELVNPRLVVAVGATAALALMGTSMAVANNRKPVTFEGRSGYLTVHPSLLLRMPEEKRRAAYRAFVADMQHVQKLAQQIGLAWIVENKDAATRYSCALDKANFVAFVPVNTWSKPLERLLPGMLIARPARGRYEPLETVNEKPARWAIE
jgi:uracil-DNA glycosylase